LIIEKEEETSFHLDRGIRCMSFKITTCLGV
jgi:hypothetical protein